MALMPFGTCCSMQLRIEWMTYAGSFSFATQILRLIDARNEMFFNSVFIVLFISHSNALGDVFLAELVLYLEHDVNTTANKQSTHDNIEHTATATEKKRCFCVLQRRKRKKNSNKFPFNLGWLLCARCDNENNKLVSDTSGPCNCCWW